MIDIIICGAKTDIEPDNLIINNLNSVNNIIIHQSDKIPPLKSINPIIIFKNSTKYLQNNDIIPPQAICILNTEDSDALCLLSKQNISAISCGMSNKNTFSISSINFPKVSICLQRQIYSISNKLIEPQEFIVNLRKEYEPYSIIAACATILIVNSSLSSTLLL